MIAPMWWPTNPYRVTVHVESPIMNYCGAEFPRSARPGSTFRRHTVEDAFYVMTADGWRKMYDFPPAPASPSADCA